MSEIIDRETYDAVKKLVKSFVYQRGIAYSGVDPDTVIDDSIQTSLHDLIAYGINGTLNKKAFDNSGMVRTQYLFESCKNRIINSINTAEFRHTIKIINNGNESEVNNKSFIKRDFTSDELEYAVSDDHKNNPKISIILEAVDNLSDLDRTIIGMMLEGYTDSEISEEVGISKNSYKFKSVFARVKKEVSRIAEKDSTVHYTVK